MPTRRTPGTAEEIVRHQKTMKAISDIGGSLSDRLDASDDRTRELFDTVFSELRDIKAKAAKGETAQATLITAVGAVELGVGELRDRMLKAENNIQEHLTEQTETRGPAVAQATLAAVQLSVPPAVKAAVKASPSLRARAAWVAAITGAFSASVLALEHVPEFLRGALHLVTLLISWK